MKAFFISSILFCLMNAFRLAETNLPYAFLVSSQSEAENTEAADFLKVFFSFNKGDRREYVDDEDSSLDSAFHSYFSELEPYLSELGLERLAANRLPLKYDRLVPADVTITVTAVLFSDEEDRMFQEGKSYSYQVLLEKKGDSGSEMQYAVVSGQVSVNQNNEVDDIYIQETEEFIGFLNPGFLEQFMT